MAQPGSKPPLFGRRQRSEEFLPHGFALGSEGGYGTEDGKLTITQRPRRQHTNRTGRRVDLDLAVLRMPGQILHRADATVGDADLMQQCRKLVAGRANEDPADQSVQLGPVLYPARVGVGKIWGSGCCSTICAGQPSVENGGPHDGDSPISAEPSHCGNIAPS